MAQANTIFSNHHNNRNLGHFSAKGASFKTSNPEIFPSLHPMGGFYNQKKPVQPNPSLNQKREFDASFEPTKKQQRLNNGLEQPVSEPEKVIAPVEKKTNKKDDYVFRVPQLPRRLREQKKAEQTEVQSKVNAPVNLGSTFVMQESLSNNAGPAKSSSLSAKKEKAAEILKTATKLQNQSVGLVDQGFDPAWLSAVYEKLILEYYALQFEQQYYMQVAQPVQQTISLADMGLNLGDLYHMNEKKSASSNLIKGQNVKREIHC